MKSLARLSLTLLLAATPLLAQESVPAADAQKYAQILAKSLAGVTGIAPGCELDLEHPSAIRAGEVGALVVPDKRVTAAKLGEVGKTAVPLGHLWLRNVSPAKDGTALGNSNFRTVKVANGDTTADAQIFVIAARRNAKDALELLVFGKGTEPILSVPLEKSGEADTTPVLLKGRKTTDESGVLTCVFFGGHKAEITLTKPAE